jgi:DNA polymerase III sliding clamp (beta) subunit (PCNA family)
MNTETTTTHTTSTGLADLTKIVEAVALHASTDKTRYALTGIYITPETITATDSYTLAQWTPAEPITTGQPALIDARELTTALKNLNKAAGKAITTATLTSDGHTWQLTATSEETTIGSYNGQTINAEHPNTKQLLDTIKPAEVPFEPTGFNADYLERITKAHNKLTKNTPLIMATWQAPTRPVIYTTTTQQGQLLTLIMPQRINQ